MAIAKKKKRFYDVSIPLVGKTTQLYDFEVKDLNSKYIKYDLTRYLRGKGTLLQAKIVANEEVAVAHPTKIMLMPYFLKRSVRKGTNYVDDSFSTETKDGSVKVKPFLVTRKKVSRRVRTALRNKCKESIVEIFKEKTAEEIFEDILRNSLQKQLSLILKKIYPLALCEIKTMRVESQQEFTIEDKEKVKEVEETPANETKEEAESETEAVDEVVEATKDTE